MSPWGGHGQVGFRWSETAYVMTTSPYSFQISSRESNDVPEPDARHALAGEADPADALPAFEHAIVADSDRTELQHFSRAVPETHNVAPVPNMLARATLVTHRAILK